MSDTPYGETNPDPSQPAEQSSVTSDEPPVAPPMEGRMANVAKTQEEEEAEAKAAEEAEAADEPAAEEESGEEE